MWLKRIRYEELVKAESLTEHLQREVEYWRRKFEDEKARADRIGDRVFEMEGRPPVSTQGMVEARASAEEIKRVMEQRMREMAGAFQEDDGSEFIGEDEKIRFAVEEKG